MTADVGPRVIYLAVPPGGGNLFKNFEDQMGKCGEDRWMIRGGSRIWIGPEDRVASYAPDNAPVAVEIRNNALIATAPVEESVRLQKQMVVRIPGKEQYGGDPPSREKRGTHACRIRQSGVLTTSWLPKASASPTFLRAALTQRSWRPPIHWSCGHSPTSRTSGCDSSRST